MGQHGQGLVEYALILVLIAVVAIASLSYIGGGVAATLSKAGAMFGPAATAPPTPAPHHEGDPCGGNDHWHFQNGQWVCR